MTGNLMLTTAVVAAVVSVVVVVVVAVVAGGAGGNGRGVVVIADGRNCDCWRPVLLRLWWSHFPGSPRAVTSRQAAATKQEGTNSMLW
jgi:hypothetical protein